MSWVTPFQNLGWNPLSIVPDSQPEHPFSVADFGFNMAGMGVLESIAQSLARDTVNLIPYGRVQVSWETFHHQTEGCFVVNRKVVPHRVQRF
jgi:hypothetical protein